MKTKEAISEKYNKEFQEITQLINLLEKGDVSAWNVIDKVQSLTICAHCDGISEGLKEANKMDKFLSKFAKG